MKKFLEFPLTVVFVCTGLLARGLQKLQEQIARLVAHLRGSLTDNSQQLAGEGYGSHAAESPTRH